MYLKHFGLIKMPFQITPDTDFFYGGAERSTILDALKYTILSGEGIIKVIGEVGCGKTMLCRMLSQSLPSSVEIVYIANPSLSPENILHSIAHEMHIHVSPQTPKIEVMQKITSALVYSHAKHKRVVVLVEEAQSMPLETLEEIRLLSNLETEQHKLMQIVLFGQPELDIKLSCSSIRQLRERIAFGFEVSPMNQKDSLEYLHFRLFTAGYRGTPLFDKKHVAVMHPYTKGLTRRMNILCNKTLLLAYTSNRFNITTKDIKTAAQDCDFYKKSYQLSSRFKWEIVK
jgi:MSHA biogenesis protein MshM